MSLRRWFLRALLILLLLAVLAPFWALGSARGLQSMLALASRLSDARFTVSEVTGSLGDGAQLIGVSLHSDGLELKLDRLSLQIDLEALFRRELHVQQVAVGELAIRLPPADPASPPLASLPSLPGLPLGVRLDELTLDTLDITPADGSPLRLTRVVGALRWPRGGALELRELSLSHARSDLTAAGRWGAQTADQLTLELHWRHQLDDTLFVQGSGQLDGAGARFQLTQDLVAPVRAHLDARLELPMGAAPWSVSVDLPSGQTLPGLPADLPLQELGATLRATGAADGAIEASVAAELGLGDYGRWMLETQAAGRSPDAIGLQRLRLAGPGDARVELHGNVDALARTVTLNGEWRAVRWPLTGAPLVESPRGTLDLAGGLEHYTYRLDADTLARVWPRANWRVSGQGSATRLAIKSLVMQSADGQASLQGEVDWANALAVQLDGQWQQLRYTLPDRQTLRSAAGRLHLAGTPGAWTANSAFDLQIGAYPRGQLSAELSGSETAVQVKTLRADFKEGQLSATGNAAWDGPAPRWEIKAAARNFNPAAVLPGWPGQLAFDLTSAGSLADFSLSLQHLVGSLRGHALRGEAAVVRKGETLTVPGVSLAAGEATLEASGGVGRGQALRWQLRVPALQALWPEGHGSITAAGEMAGELARPTLKGALAIEALQVPGLALEAASADWDLDLAGRREQLLRLSLQGLATAGRSLSTDLHVAGPLSGLVLESHTQLAADETLALQLTGALTLDPPRWRGALETGQWARGSTTRMTLAQPAAMALSAAGARLERQCWQGEGRLCLGGQVDADGHWQAALESDALLLEALPRLGDWQRGALSGGLEARGRGAVLTQAAGQLKLAPTVWTLEDEELPPIGHHGVTLALATSEAGLKLELEAGLDQPAPLNAGLVLALPGGPWDLSAPGTLPLQGRLRASAPKLAPWAAYSDEVAELAGEVNLNFGLSGSLAEPVIDGGATLDLSKVQLTRLGIELKDVALKLSGGREHQLRVDGRLRSGPGKAEVHGTVSMLAEGLGADLRIISDDLQVLDLPMASVQASARLDLDVFPHKAVLKGEVTIPKAQLTVRQTNARTERSDDVTTDEDEAAIRRAFGLETDLWIRLGEQVKLDAMGLKGRLAGQLHLLEQPQQATRASGELRIEEGHYAQWGQDLNLRNSRVIYTGQSITDPAVDARAERVIGDVTAGLRVTGRLLEPVARLYSSPAMGDADVLSYLVAGQPLSKASSTDANALMGAAATLGLRGSSMLTDRIAHTFGLDEIKVGGNPYDKNLALTVGKYLSPRLYVGYGMGLVDDVNTFRLRYSLSKRWNVEAETGSRSSADLLYTIER